MDRILSVECLRRGAPLRARPEWLTFSSRGILWVLVQQIANRVIISGVKDISSLRDDSRDIASFLDIHQAADILKLLTHTRGSTVLPHLGNQGLGVTDELNGILDAAAEKRVELVTTPLDTMLDLVWEVSQCAHGDGILVLRVLRVTVGLGHVRHDHL